MPKSGAEHVVMIVAVKRDEQRDAQAVEQAGEQVAAGARLDAERVLPG